MGVDRATARKPRETRKAKTRHRPLRRDSRAADVGAVHRRRIRRGARILSRAVRTDGILDARRQMRTIHHMGAALLLGGVGQDGKKDLKVFESL